MFEDFTRGFGNRVDYINGLRDFHPDIILSDHSLPSFNSFEALELLKESGLNKPFILITATISEEFAVQAMKAGATDYILKDRMQRLPNAVLNSIEKFKLEADRKDFLDGVITSEALLRQAESIANMGSLDIDLVTQKRKWSAGMDSILGYAAGQIEQTFESFLKRVHPDDLRMVTRKIVFAIENLDAVDLEFRLITPAGQLKHVHSRLLISKNQAGKPIRANGFIQDVTEKKLAEISLNRANNEITRLFNTIDETFYSKDVLSSKLIQISPACEKLYGYKADEFLTDHSLWDNVIYQEDKTILLANEELLLKGNTVIAQYRIVHKNNSIRWVETKVIPELDANNRLIRLDGVNRDITKSKKAELDLKESEQRFRELIENSGDMVTVSNADGLLTYISPNVRKIMGYDPAALITNFKGGDFFHPDEIENYRNLFAEIRQNPGKTYQFTNRVKHADGSWLWIEGAVTNLLHMPAVNGVVTNFRDVSERKNAETLIAQNHIQLQEAAQTQAAILNALPPNIALVNEKGKIMAVNASWKKFTNLNNLGLPNYGVGYNYITIAEKATGVDKYSGIKMAKGIKDVIAGKKIDFMLEYRCDTGVEKRWFQAIVAPLNDKTQKGVVVLHTNITARKMAQESLAQSEANLRSVFENTDISVILFDNDLKVLSFNRNASDLFFSFLNKKLKKGTAGMAYFPKDRKEPITQILQRVKKNEMVTYEVCYHLKNERIAWFEARWVRVLNNSNEPIGLILTFKNITDKKNADLERNKMMADLVKRNNDLEQFTYIISHNLRAPLANIKGLTDLLKNFEYAEADCVETLRALSLSVDSLDKVIIDLNQILQTGNDASERIEAVSLYKLVEDITTEIMPVVLKNNAAITCDFNAVDNISTLKSYLYSIFQNLIINSIKYRRIDANPEINISTKIIDDKICICFADNGKGIDMLRHGHQLFGLYKRFDYTVDGKGMGLFMVKRQVQRLGGTITVKSELHKGTEFFVELPR